MPVQLNFAKPLARFGSFFLDALVLGVLSWLLFGNQCAGTGLCVSYNNEQTLIPLAYYIGFWIWRSATPGQMALGLRVVDDKGNPITPKQAIIRALMQLVSGIVAGLGYLWILFDDKRQGWHDKVSKSFVVNE